MMEHENPYAPPVSAAPITTDGEGLMLASRSSRFVAALLDTVFITAAYLALRFILLQLGWVSDMWGLEDDVRMDWLMNLLSIGVFYLIQWHFLSQSGQTIGKKMMGIRIVNLEGEKPSMFDLIVRRYGFMNFLGLIPVVGRWIALLDILFIFGEERRCLHDYVAGTRVVRNRA